MKKNILKWVVVAGLACLGSTWAIAQDGVALPYLIEQPGVRMRSLGGAIIPSAGAGMHLYGNFGTRHQLPQQKLEAAYSLTLWPDNGMGVPQWHTLATSMLSGKHALGVGFRYCGGTEVQARNQAGELYGIRPYDWTLDAAYSYALLPHMALHVGGSYYRSYVGLRAAGVLFNTGLSYYGAAQVSDRPLEYIISLEGRNIGAGVRYGADGAVAKLPTEVSMSGGLRRVLAGSHALGVGLRAGLVTLPSRAEMVYGVGSEYSYKEMLHIRAGYEHKLGMDNLSVGAGWLYCGVGIDLAYTMASQKGFNSLSMALSYRF